MTPIDHTSPIPIYHQLKGLIKDQVKEGSLRPGDRVPTERELCQTHRISRSPVRQALNELAHEGLVVRKPGLGTFITNQVDQHVSAESVVRTMCSDPRWSAALDHISKVWNAEHGAHKIAFDIEVVLHARLYDHLRAAVGSGTAPDLAMVDSVWVAGLADAGFLYALGDLGSPWTRTDFAEDRYPAFIEANSLGERLYGVPVKADASVLWYRRDWFAEEGLTPPADWRDLRRVSAHFLQTSVQRRYGLTYPLAFPGGAAGGEATVYTLMPFIWSAGGEIFDASMTHVTLNSPHTHAALTYLRDLVHLHQVSSPDVIGYGHATSAKLFAEGKVAMALGGSYEAETIQFASCWDDEAFHQRVGAVAPPAPREGEPVSTIGGTSYVILRQSQHPTLLSDLLKVATDPRVIGDYCRSMSLNLPNPSFNRTLDQDAEPLSARFAKMIASGRARPSIAEYVKVSHQLQAMFEATLSGDEPINALVQRTAKFISVVTELPSPATQPQGTTPSERMGIIR